MDIMGFMMGFIGVGGIVISILLMVGVAVGGWFFLRSWQRYRQYDVLVMRIDALGNRAARWDKAGIFIKNGQKRFWLKKSKADIAADAIKHIDIGGKRTVFLWELSDNDLRVVDFSDSNPAEGLVATIGEEDVNWGLLAYERGKKMFWWQGLLKEYLPYVLIFFVGIIMVIIFVQFFKKLDIFPAAIEAMKENSEILKSTAEILREVKSGTTVIGG